MGFHISFSRVAEATRVLSPNRRIVERFKVLPQLRASERVHEKRTGDAIPHHAESSPSSLPSPISFLYFSLFDTVFGVFADRDSLTTDARATSLRPD
jgi:hypothetical protein